MAQFPNILNTSGVELTEVGFGFGLIDNRLFRTQELVGTARGKLMLIHQGKMKKPFTGNDAIGLPICATAADCCGAIACPADSAVSCEAGICNYKRESLFVMADLNNDAVAKPTCGESWKWLSTIDPCDKSMFPGREFCPISGIPSGFDQPHIAQRESQIDIFVNGQGWQKGNLKQNPQAVRIVSTDSGKNWSYDQNWTNAEPTPLPTPTWIGDQLVAFLCKGSTDIQSPSLVAFNGATPNGTNKVISIPGGAPACSNDVKWAKPMIARIGQYGADYYLRIGYPIKGAAAKQVDFYLATLKVSNPAGATPTIEHVAGSPSVIHSSLPSTGGPNAKNGSILQATAVESNELDMPNAANETLLYWMETSESDPAPYDRGGNYGNVGVVGCVLRDTETACECLSGVTPLGGADPNFSCRFALSRNTNGTLRTFPGYARSTDFGFGIGAFRYDAGSKRKDFIAQWVETPALNPPASPIPYFSTCRGVAQCPGTCNNQCTNWSEQGFSHHFNIVEVQ